MKNFLKEGNVVNVTAAAAIASGDMVAIGNVLGVAVTDGAIGDVVACMVRGEFILPTAAGLTITAGDALNFDASAGVVTTAATADTGDITGAAVATAGAASGEPVQALINGGGGTAS